MKIVVMVAAVLVFFFSVNAQAAMVRVSLNIFTTNYPLVADRQLNVYMEVFNNTATHPPSYISKIEVFAPDGSVLNVDPNKDWRPYDRSYGKAFYADEFIGEKFPGNIHCDSNAHFWNTHNRGG